MLTKVFPTGQGRGFGPVEYLCSSNPFGRGEREKAPQILSGDPALIKRQIDANPYKYKYTSGVHSFAPEDRPTDDQLMEVIEATEDLAFAGLPLSSRSILWVKHENAGRTELHFLIPRQEVNSGKAFNAFPPGWQQKYDPLRDKLNYKYGWARPDDLERARHWQPGINAEILADAKRQKKPNPKAEVFNITDDLANMAIQGKLGNRADIISELRKRGYGINRQGKDYVTIVDKEGKKTRLKGTLFAENFNGLDWVKAKLEKFNKPNSEKILVDQKLAEEADAKLQEAIKKTAEYNSKRYSMKEIENEQSTGNQHTLKAEINAGKMGKSIGSHPGKPASFQQPLETERHERYALYSESGLGEGAENRSAWDTLWADAGNSFQKSSLSDSSLSVLGRAMEKGSGMAERNRGTTERLHGRRDKYPQHNFGTGSSNNRRQFGEPGGYDEADHGYVERIARQSEWTGEYGQSLTSLRKNREKLAKRLSEPNQPIQQTSDFALNLNTGLAQLRYWASQSVSGLRSLNENNLLSEIKKSINSTASLRIAALQTNAGKVINVLKKIADLHQLEIMSLKFMGLRKLPVNSLSFDAEKICIALRKVNEYRLIKKWLILCLN